MNAQELKDKAEHCATEALKGIENGNYAKATTYTALSKAYSALIAPTLMIDGSNAMANDREDDDRP